MDTKQKLENIMHEIKTQAQKNLVDNPDDFLSCVFLVSPRFEIAVVPFVFKTAEEKHAQVHAIRYAASMSGTIAIIAEMDTWISPPVPREKFERGEYVLPSKRADRQEALVITCTSRVLNRMDMIAYTRESGKIVFGEETTNCDMEDMNFGILFRGATH